MWWIFGILTGNCSSSWSSTPEQGMDVLVLYDCIHFLEDFKFY